MAKAKKQTLKLHHIALEMHSDDGSRNGGEMERREKSGFLALALLYILEGRRQRGLNSKRGPRSFHPLLSLRLLEKYYCIAPKACRMSLTWESFADESLKCKYSRAAVRFNIQQDIHFSMPVFIILYFSMFLTVFLLYRSENFSLGAVGMRGNGARASFTV